MTLWIYWILIAILALVIEVFTGTVYLLVIGVAAIGTALGVWLFDIDYTVAWLLASFIALIGTVWIYFYRKNKKIDEQKHDVMNNDFDIGAQVVLMQKTAEHQWQVRYRGSIWEAKVNDENAQSGAIAIITARKGNLLYLDLFKAKQE